MEQAQIKGMGEIDVVGPDGLIKYPIAMLITFETPEAARQAFKDGECKIEF